MKPFTVLCDEEHCPGLRNRVGSMLYTSKGKSGAGVDLLPRTPGLKRLGTLHQGLFPC